MQWHHSKNVDQQLLKYICTEERRVDGPDQVAAGEEDVSIFAYVIKESIRLSLCFKGKRIEGKVDAGEIVYIPDQAECTLSSASITSARVVLIYFQWLESQDKNRIRGATPILETQAINTNIANRFMSVPMPHFHNWLPDFIKTDRSSDLRMYYLVQSYLYAVVSTFLSFVQRSVKSEDTLLDYVRQMKQSLLERLDHTLDMEEMARSSGYSTRFYRMFRKLTGLSPHKFMTTIRLNHSLSLLASTQLSVTEIAHSLGYTDELYFSRLFKKNMGLTPTEFSKLSQRRLVVLHPALEGNLSVLGITPHVSLPDNWIVDGDKHMKLIEDTQPEFIFSPDSPDVPEDILTSLAQVAPVVQFKMQALSWKERLFNMSQALGLTQVAERWLTYYDLKVTNAVQMIEEQVGQHEFLIASMDSNKFRLFGKQNRMVGDFFYREMRLESPECVQQINIKEFNSLGDLAKLACPHILLLAPIWVPEETLVQVEEAWRRLQHHTSYVICLIVRHAELLLDHAVCYDHIIDQTVNLLVQER